MFGTLTQDCVLQPELHGMIPVDNGMLTTAQRTAVLWPARVKQAVAVCNSLNLIAKNKVVGDLADQQGFRSVEAQFLVRLAYNHVMTSCASQLCVLVITWKSAVL